MQPTALHWGMTLKITCGLTVRTPGSAPGPTLGDDRVWDNFYVNCAKSEGREKYFNNFIVNSNS